jgi:hypothetical protein
MVEEKYNPWVRKSEKIGSAQAGTHVFSRVGKNGISEKVIVDDVVVNGPLCPPPSAENAVLAGGVNVEVELDTDYTTKVVDGGRLRTCELIIRTLVSPLAKGTYGKGATKPDSSPEANQGPKQ